MKKSELIEIVSSKLGENKVNVAAVIDSTLDAIKEALIAGDVVDIYGFAKFESVTQPARLVRNPKTGETKENPSKKVPKCRFKSAIKESLKNS